MSRKFISRLARVSGALAVAGLLFAGPAGAQDDDPYLVPPVIVRGFVVEPDVPGPVPAADPAAGPAAGAVQVAGVQIEQPDGALPVTGSDALTMAALAGAAIALGGGMVVVSRRRARLTAA